MKAPLGCPSLPLVSASLSPSPGRVPSVSVASPDVFLCVGERATGLRLLLYRLLCRLSEEQRRGRLERSALREQWKAGGREVLDQPLLLLLAHHQCRGEEEGHQGKGHSEEEQWRDRRDILSQLQSEQRGRAGEGGGGAACSVGGSAAAGAEVWESIQVRPVSDLTELSEVVLSLSSLPLPPRMVLLDELPPPPRSARSSLSPFLSSPCELPSRSWPHSRPSSLSPPCPPLVGDWRSTQCALDSALDCITQAVRHRSMQSTAAPQHSTGPVHLHRPTESGEAR